MKPPSAVPYISEALIEYLERIYPDRLGDETEDASSVRFRSGNVHVVRHVRAAYERQNRDVMNTEALKRTQ